MLQGQEAAAWFTGFVSSEGDSLVFDDNDWLMLGERRYDRVTLKTVLQSGENRSLFSKRNECATPLPQPIESIGALRSYLEGLFDQPTVESLLATQVEGQPLYVEENGKLYRFGGYIGQLDYDAVRMSLKTTQQGDSQTISAKLQYSAWGNLYSCEYDYQLKKNANNQWVFTNYKLPASLCLETGERMEFPGKK